MYILQRLADLTYKKPWRTYPDPCQCCSPTKCKSFFHNTGNHSCSAKAPGEPSLVPVHQFSISGYFHLNKRRGISNSPRFHASTSPPLHFSTVYTKRKRWQKGRSHCDTFKGTEFSCLRDLIIHMIHRHLEGPGWGKRVRRTCTSLECLPDSSRSQVSSNLIVVKRPGFSEQLCLRIPQLCLGVLIWGRQTSEVT